MVSITKKICDFKKDEYVVYPSHGVGKVIGVETLQMDSSNIEFINIEFCHDRMTLSVPADKASDSGLRRLSSHEQMRDMLRILRGKSRIKRTMWARRAQEYESKINSGDPIAIAEVVRDLFRGVTQPDQTYSERQLYRAALQRLAREYAVVKAMQETEAFSALEDILNKVAA